MITICIILVLPLLVNSTICFASQASSLPSSVVIKIAENYDYGFIGTATNKTIESDRTYYVFNVTEYLKNPLNATKITLTAYGGYENGVSPSISFSLGHNYLVFFNELDEDNKIIGFDYNSKFLGSFDDSDILSIREVVNQVSATELAVSAYHKQLDNAYNINITNTMKYQMEYPESSGNILDVWRIDIRGEGLDENGNLVWRAIVFQVILETGELVIGPVTEIEIADDTENRQLISFARTLVPVALFSLAGIISIFLLKKNR